MSKMELAPFVGAAQGPRTISGLSHPTPAHIKGCVLDALHNLHESGVPVPVEAYRAVREGVAKANAEHDAGVL